MKTFTVFLLSK